MALEIEANEAIAGGDQVFVGADLYVLASGIWPETGGARLTLQLEPAPLASGTLVEIGNVMTLQTWPRDIGAKLRNGVRLTFVPLANADPSLPPRPVAEDEIRFDARVLGLPEQSEQTRDASSKLWISMLAGGDELPDHRYRAPSDTQAPEEKVPDGTWSDLSKAITSSQANRGVMGGSAMQDGSGTVADLSIDQLGNEGQIPPRPVEDSAGISAIVAVPHGDLAVALDQQRTEELCLSLKESCGLSGQHKGAEEKRRQELKRDNVFDAIRQLLDAPSQEAAGKVNEALGTAIEISDPPDEDQEALLAELRKALKQRERAALSGKLARSRQATAKAYCDEQKRLDDGKCDTKDPVQPTHLCGITSLDQKTREAAMDRACAAHHYTSWPQYADRSGGDRKTISVPDPFVTSRLTETAIVKRYASLKSDPVLARLFGLSVDIELGRDEFASLADGFYLVTAQLADDLTGEDSETCAGKGLTWTLLEVSGQGSDVKFWPATERAALRQNDPDAKGLPRQSHGLIALSQGACGEGAALPRFDLTSLELRTATEGEMQRRLARKATVDSADPRDPDESDPTNPLPTDALPEADDFSLGAKYLTGGLTLLLRSSGTDMAVRLARRDGRLKVRSNCPDIVLDADDLTTGVRPILGVPDGADFETRWSPLTARDIDYGTSGSQREAVRSLIRSVFGSTAMLRLRDTLEAGFLTTPSRLLPTADSDQEAVVDEAFTTWDGTPMGVDVTSLDEAASDVHVFGRKLDLPRKSLDALRFGVPYRFALAAVFSGGISRAVETLPTREETEEAASLYPAPIKCGDGIASAAKPFFRYLRHEKIAAPQFALPLGHALRSGGQRLRQRGTVRNQTPFIQAGPMGFDTGPRMVVRSLGPTGEREQPDYDARMEARKGPAICHRVVMAPSVPFDCAEWHGAFDGLNSGNPKGDFQNMTGARALIGARGTLAGQRDRNDRENLIVARTNLQRGIGNQSVLDTRTYTDVPNAELTSDTLKLGDAILKRKNEVAGQRLSALSNEQNLNRYYADPLARRLAFGIRIKGSECYLAGGPIVYQVADVPERPGDPTASVFSQVPVVVTCVTSDGPPRRTPTDVSELLIVGPDQPIDWLNSDAPGDGFLGRNRHFYALELRLGLRAGEEVEIDVWALPDEDLLAREHALIQSLGIKLSAQGRKESAQVIGLQAIKLGAELSMPDAFVRAIVDAETEIATAPAKPTDQVSFIGPCGIETPTTKALKVLGRAVTAFLQRAPLPEICGKTTLEAVHATNRMPQRPAALVPDEPIDPQYPVLPALAELEQGQAPAMRPVRAARPANMDGSPRDPLSVSSPGSTHLVLDGTLAFDVAGNDILEIVADVTLPGSSVFDDANRKRSLAHRRKGTWPPLRGLDGSPLLDGEDNTRYRSAEDLFGFKVSRDGNVEFSTARVTLLRVEGLPRSVAGDRLDLRALFLGDLPDGAREAHRHVFPDGKARRMNVSINALSRTLEDMRTVARVARTGDPWTRGEGRIYDVGAQVPGRVVPPRHQTNLSDEAEIVLPATIRPAKPDAKAPMPLLETEDSPPPTARKPWIYHKRNSTLRIPLGREWYSSGEDEAVGVVLWPPVCDGVEKPYDNKVTVPGRYPGDPERRIDLDALAHEDYFFNDADLGPGGKFVSRRGSDPVRGGTETEPVLHPSAIADLLRDSKDIRRSHIVENVLMPLDDEGFEPDAAKEAKVPPMRVALALYTPRFDVEREEWFIDISLDAPMAPDGFVRLGLVRYQPHTVPELRCSRPVVQWAQPLSARAVYARKEGDKKLTIEMTGAAPQERKPIPATATGNSVLGVDLAALTCQPAMRLTLFREMNEEGKLRRVLLKRKSVVNVAALVGNEGEDMQKATEFGLDADTVLVTPERLTDPLARWRHTIDLDEYTDGLPEEVRESSQGKLRLLVEEIEHFRPASYAEEPLASATSAAWQNMVREAGPRFSALLDLEKLE